jgi:hypothetical protein
VKKCKKVNVTVSISVFAYIYLPQVFLTHTTKCLRNKKDIAKQLKNFPRVLANDLRKQEMKQMYALNLTTAGL